MKNTLLLFLFMGYLSNTVAAQDIQTDVDTFIKNTAINNNLDEKSIRLIIEQAEKKQSIIDAMNRPAEKKKQWYEYRAIFLKQKRIDQGIEFWSQYQDILQQVSDESGVPIEIIVAIIGVETNYGGNKGSYRVLDALYTLAFHYPKRSKFFTKELEKFMVLTHKENISALETKGSYAGAMGFGQFMPSSYLMYAVDFDKDGKRDLLDNIPDAIASVANYFKAHGWKKGQGVVHPVTVRDTFTVLKKQKLKPSLSVKQLNDMGYISKQQLVDSELVSLTQLQQKNHKEYWFGMHNFYVITRYNHSEMYAMAVYQLAQEIKTLKNK